MINGTPWWTYLVSGAASVAAILAFIQSGRAVKLIRFFGFMVSTIETSIGKVDAANTRPSMGGSISDQVASLHENQVAFIKNQLLIAETLRLIYDDLGSMKGRGLRRLPTDAIMIPVNLEAENNEHSNY